MFNELLYRVSGFTCEKRTKTIVHISHRQQPYVEYACIFLASWSLSLIDKLLLSFSASQLLCFSASLLLSFSASLLLSFSAFQLLSFSASQLLCFSASQLLCFSASELFWFLASNIFLNSIFVNYWLRRVVISISTNFKYTWIFLKFIFIFLVINW